MSVKKILCTLVTLVTVSVTLTSCFNDPDSDETNEDVETLLDLTLEDFAESDFNSAFILDSLRSVSERSDFKENYSTADSLNFTFTEDGFISDVSLTAERNPEGLITKMYFNDTLITGEPGNNYFSNASTEGDLSNLPSVIPLDLGYNTLALPSFYSVRPLSSILGLINEGLEMKGQYNTSRHLVEMLIMERILSSDSIIDFATTENIIYALMRPTDSEAGEYLLWYDGEHLTMAGNLSFTRGL